MMTRGGEGGKKCRKFDDVICERPLSSLITQQAPRWSISNLRVSILQNQFSGYGVSNSLRWKDLTDNSASYIVTVMIVGYFCPLVIITYCYRSIYQLVQVSNFTSCYCILRFIDSFEITGVGVQQKKVMPP